MNALERFRATMEYAARDRAPFQQFPWPTWPETEERWAREGGYNPKTTDFGLDKWVVEYSWFMPAPPFERTVLAEDADYVTYVDPQGIVMREFKHNPLSSMPQFISFPVQSRDDFRKFWRERMQPDLSMRIGPDWRERLRCHRDRNYVFVVIADRWGGFFGPPRNLVGLEGLCALFYDDPAFVEEMLEAHGDFLIGMLSQILEETTIDVFGFWEDMCYNAGPLLSPALARKFMLPQYRRVIDFGRSRGVKYFGLDSDGRVDLLIPMWMDAGVDILYPFEVAAGMDVLQVRKKFGRQLRIWGGVDKRALVKGPAAINEEIGRRKPLIDDGGYVPHLDHSAPPDISYANYRYFLESLRAAL
jgi:Uroporphyrinogen decarboxylase (URO-D)